LLEEKRLEVTIAQDAVVKTSNSPIYVIPAIAGIQCFQADTVSGYRRNDSPRKFLRTHQKIIFLPPPLRFRHTYTASLKANVITLEKKI
jgi:hypothetical protein